ncbi:hypothetical protein Pfo_012781 [Paulownia fortunei]|nr:hypothetical protein Pfo_012781 [Paulownia fortunei]
MATNGSTTSVELAIGIVGTWKLTYQWTPIFGGFAAFALAFSAGANNIPISLIVAFVLYVPGTALASNSTIYPLLSKFIRENQPSESFLMWSMIVVLITATLWLAVATYFALPVSSQQSTRAALLGTMLVNKGWRFVPLWNKDSNHNFNDGGLLWIFLECTVAPMISCACAFCFFMTIRKFILRHENGEKRIFIFLPFYYGISAGLLSLFIMDQVIPNFLRVCETTIIVAIAMATMIGALLSLLLVVPLARLRIDSSLPTETATKQNISLQQCTERQNQSCDAKDDDNDNFEDAVRDFMQMRVLNTVYEEDEQSCVSPQVSPEIEHILSPPQSTRGQSAAFKQLLESTPTPNLLVITYDRKTLIRHALAEKFDEMEDLIVQSVSETAALMSPFQIVLEIFKFRSDFSRNDEYVGSFHVNWCFRAAGGLGASIGFLFCGWRLTQCLTSRLTYISNSRGLAFQLSAVATMILVNRANLPVSSVHASIGALVGVGIADEPRNVNWKLLLKFLLGWVMTIIFCCLVACGIYSSSIHSPAYVVP